MKAVLKLEEFDNIGYAKYMGRDKSNPWVAKILGFDDTYFFNREFIRGQRDYSQAKMTGSRGIFIYFALDDGIYEVNKRISWKHVKRYFVLVESAEITEISREKVIACLTNET